MSRYQINIRVSIVKVVVSRGIKKYCISFNFLGQARTEFRIPLRTLDF